jgi:soluble lytic murein transglycosylase-like protein
MSRNPQLTMSRILRRSSSILLAAGFAFTCANVLPARAQSRLKHKPNHAKSKTMLPAPATPAAEPEGEVIGKRIKFVDGSSLEVNEVWKQQEGYWYRLGGVTRLIDRPVGSIEAIRAKPKAEVAQVSAPAGNSETPPVAAKSFWIYLKGGARMKVDEVRENDAGAWYSRGNLAIFIERERIARIERESEGRKERPGWIDRDWTTGNTKIDDLIRSNGARFGVDPYLVFCVIEHESHFRVQAVSPKGARGLMQLMPGTAARFGVRKSFDPAQNIFGGTQYLKELLEMFNGRLDLALASYNAGEGAVVKYGRQVPPYRETRDYVRLITRRYGGDKTDSPERVPPAPR